MGMSLEQKPPSRNLFIAGFKSDMTDAALRAIFAPFGAIESAKVMLDIHTGASRGFAFVLFANLDDAVKARTNINGSVHTLVEGRPVTFADQFKLTVEFAKHDAYNVVTKNVKVYCRNIPTTVDENIVAELMHKWVGPGSVVTVAIMPDSSKSPAMFGAPPQRSAGADVKPLGNVAFIEFKTADDAQRAVDLTYSVRLDGPGSVGPLMTKFAETAEVRNERMRRQPSASASSTALPSTAGSNITAPSTFPPVPMMPPPTFVPTPPYTSVAFPHATPAYVSMPPPPPPLVGIIQPNGTIAYVPYSPESFKMGTMTSPFVAMMPFGAPPQF